MVGSHVLIGPSGASYVTGGETHYIIGLENKRNVVQSLINYAINIKGIDQGNGAIKELNDLLRETENNTNGKFNTSKHEDYAQRIDKAMLRLYNECTGTSTTAAQS